MENEKRKVNLPIFLLIQAQEHLSNWVEENEFDDLVSFSSKSQEWKEDKWKCEEREWGVREGERGWKGNS